MLVSIIIPTKNRYLYLTDLLSDLRKQTYKNTEIIVADQSDSFEEIVCDYHIKLVTSGPCSSRNTAVKYAKGKVLLFLDDDARIEEDFVAEIISPILQEKYAAVAGAICDTSGNYLRKANQFLKDKTSNFIKVLTSNPDSNTSRPTISFPAGCSAILKEVFIKLGGFDESFDPTGAGEDRDFALNLYFNGYGIWYNAKAKLMHIAASSGGSREMGSRTIMLDVHTVIIARKYFSENCSNELKNLIIRHYRNKIFKSLVSFKQFGTRYRNYKIVKNMLR